MENAIDACWECLAKKKVKLSDVLEAVGEDVSELGLFATKNDQNLEKLARNESSAIRSYVWFVGATTIHSNPTIDIPSFFPLALETLEKDGDIFVRGSALDFVQEVGSLVLARVTRTSGVDVELGGLGKEEPTSILLSFASPDRDILGSILEKVSMMCLRDGSLAIRGNACVVLGDLVAQSLKVGVADCGGVLKYLFGCGEDKVGLVPPRRKRPRCMGSSDSGRVLRKQVVEEEEKKIPEGLFRIVIENGLGVECKEGLRQALHRIGEEANGRERGIVEEVERLLEEVWGEERRDSFVGFPKSSVPKWAIAGLSKGWGLSDGFNGVEVDPEKLWQVYAKMCECAVEIGRRVAPQQNAVEIIAEVGDLKESLIAAYWGSGYVLYGAQWDSQAREFAIQIHSLSIACLLLPLLSTSEAATIAHSIPNRHLQIAASTSARLARQKSPNPYIPLSAAIIFASRELPFEEAAIASTVPGKLNLSPPTPHSHSTLPYKIHISNNQVYLSATQSPKYLTDHTPSTSLTQLITEKSLPEPHLSSPFLALNFE